MDLGVGIVDLDAERAAERNTGHIQADIGLHTPRQTRIGQQQQPAAVFYDHKVSRTVAKTQAHVGRGDLNDRPLDRGPARRIGGGDLFERKVAFERLTGDIELDSRSFDPDVRPGRNVQRQHVVAHYERFAYGQFGIVDRDPERAHKVDRGARHGDRHHACDLAGKTRAGYQQRACAAGELDHLRVGGDFGAYPERNFRRGDLYDLGSRGGLGLLEHEVTRQLLAENIQRQINHLDLNVGTSLQNVRNGAIDAEYFIHQERIKRGGLGAITDKDCNIRTGSRDNRISGRNVQVERRRDESGQSVAVDFQKGTARDNNKVIGPVAESQDHAGSNRANDALSVSVATLLELEPSCTEALSENAEAGLLGEYSHEGTRGNVEVDGLAANLEAFLDLNERVVDFHAERTAQRNAGYVDRHRRGELSGQSAAGDQERALPVGDGDKVSGTVAQRQEHVVGDDAGFTGGGVVLECKIAAERKPAGPADSQAGADRLDTHVRTGAKVECNRLAANLDRIFDRYISGVDRQAKRPAKRNAGNIQRNVRTGGARDTRRRDQEEALTVGHRHDTIAQVHPEISGRQLDLLLAE